MEKEFIPYEIALELKQLGFDEECLAFFKDEEFKIPSSNEPFKNSELKSWFVTAPLYQQAFRWFRKKYKLDFYIRNSESGCGFGGVTTHKSNFFFLYISNGYWKFNSNEEAELECLKKLIEIVKKQQEYESNIIV
jgi:hypothetical protein